MKPCFFSLSRLLLKNQSGLVLRPTEIHEIFFTAPPDCLKISQTKLQTMNLRLSPDLLISWLPSCLSTLKQYSEQWNPSEESCLKRDHYVDKCIEMYFQQETDSGISQLAWP